MMYENTRKMELSIRSWCTKSQGSMLVSVKFNLFARNKFRFSKYIFELPVDTSKDDLDMFVLQFDVAEDDL